MHSSTSVRGTAAAALPSTPIRAARALPRPPRRAGLAAALAAVALPLLGPGLVAAASTVTWDGSDSTLWATGANWSTNAVPTAVDTAVFPDFLPTAGGNEITLPTGAAVAGLDFSRSWVLSGGDLTLTGGAVNVASNSTA